MWSVLCSFALLTILFDNALAAPRPLIGGPLPVTPSGVPLWPKKGPSCSDVTQTSVPDCFLAATLCIIADRGPHWLQTAVQEDQPAPDGSDVASAKFHLFQTQAENQIGDIGQSSTDYWIDVNFKDDVAPNANDDGTLVWWVGGFQQAAKKQFGSNYLDGGITSQALAMLTNRSVVDIFDNSQEAYYNAFTHAASSCVTLGTQSNSSKLTSDHAYAVYSSRMSGNNQMVTLHNPWDSTTEYKLSDIYNDIQHVTHFENWDQLDS